MEMLGIVSTGKDLAPSAGGATWLELPHNTVHEGVGYKK